MGWRSPKDFPRTDYGISLREMFPLLIVLWKQQYWEKRSWWHKLPGGLCWRLESHLGEMGWAYELENSARGTTDCSQKWRLVHLGACIRERLDRQRSANHKKIEASKRDFCGKLTDLILAWIIWQYKEIMFPMHGSLRAAWYKVCVKYNTQKSVPVWSYILKKSKFKLF